MKLAVFGFSLGVLLGIIDIRAGGISVDYIPAIVTGIPATLMALWFYRQWKAGGPYMHP